MPPQRDEIEEKYKWDLTHLFADKEAWNEKYTSLLKDKTERYFWPNLAQENHPIKTGDDLKKLLESLNQVEREVTNLYIYAFLWHDEDVALEESKKAYEMSTLLFYRLGEETSWVRPAILELSEEITKNPVLKEFEMYLKKILDVKPYTLSSDKEALLSLASKPLVTSQQTFSVFNNADLQFAPAKTKNGEEKPLSHGTYALYLQNTDRVLRETAFTNLHTAYGQFENTLTELLQGHIHTHNLNARARGYKSCLHAALQPNNIDTSVYTTLIETVSSNCEPLHKYVELRKNILGYDKLYSYDFHVPLSSEIEKKYTYEEAVDLIIESVAPLGEEYQSILHDGLLAKRWVDVYETQRKRSGAFSCSSYDSPPFILMNFHGTLRDVMTLAHEAGHSMHSYFSNRTQPFHDAGYPIFVAEVASTFNEELVFLNLLKRTETAEERGYLINRKIDDIRSTLFRQVQFAEFELFLHQMAERGEPFTANRLKEEYARLNKVYYGDAFTESQVGNVEFMRVPHFYSNYYVYQYATGISAAHSLVEMVLHGGVEEQQKYLAFLSSGGSKYPLDLLKIAGVDISKPEPTEKLIAHFDALTSELAQVQERITQSG